MTDLERDALRWRALIGSDRIRVLGSAGIGKDHQHVGLELWDVYPEEKLDTDGHIASREVLTKYVDTIIHRDATSLLLAVAKGDYGNKERT